MGQPIERHTPTPDYWPARPSLDSLRLPLLVFGVGLLVQISLAFVAPLRSYAGEQRDQVVTYLEDIKWTPVVPPDSEGRAIFVSLLYGDLARKEPTEFLMKYSAGRRATPHLHTHDYYAVVVSGAFRHFLRSQEENRIMTPGSSWHQKGYVVHDDYCEGPDDCILAVYFPKGFDVTFVKPTE